MRVKGYYFKKNSFSHLVGVLIRKSNKVLFRKSHSNLSIDRFFLLKMLPAFQNFSVRKLECFKSADSKWPACWKLVVANRHSDFLNPVQQLRLEFSIKTYDRLSWVNCGSKRQDELHLNNSGSTKRRQREKRRDNQQKQEDINLP